jgi:molybdenum cofactor synthesis domain-containing protein
VTPGADLRVRILVLSDRCARGEREDRSGPALAAWLDGRGVDAAPPVTVLPDDQARIAAWLRTTCEEGSCDVILTCGGTGVAPRDLTPEATRSVVEIELPGFGEAMRAAGRASQPRAIIGRGLAGLRRGVLVINLPGSPGAAVENLAAVWPAVAHTVAKAQGDPRDCGT